MAAAPTSTCNEDVGNTNGVSPDERAGIVPAAAKVTNLKDAANKAGCELRLKLPDEGHTTSPKGSQPPELQDQPADLRQPRRTALPAG